MAGIELGASRVVEALLFDKKESTYDLARTIVRVWGFVILAFVAFMQFVFDTWSGHSKAITVWLATYFAYLLLLVSMRGQAQHSQGRLSHYYESSWFRGVRIAVNLAFFTWLVAVSSDGRLFSWLLYLMPIFASIIYFARPIWTVVTFVGVAIGLYTGGIWLAKPDPLGAGQYLAMVAMLAVLSAVLWWLFQRVLLEPNNLAGVTRKLYQTLDLEALLNQITELSVQLTGADRSLVIIVDPQHRRYVTHVSRGFDLRVGHSIEEAADRCYVLRTGKLFETHDMMRQFNDESLYAKLFRCQPRSVLAEPILSTDGQVLGVLNATHDGPHRFDFLSRGRIRQLSSQVGGAVENCLRYRQSRLREAKNWEVSKKLALVGHEEEIAALLISEVRELISAAEGSVLHYLDQRDETLHPWRTLPIDRTTPDESAMDLVGLAGRALEMAEPILVSDVTEHPWSAKSAQAVEFSSLLIAPLIGPDREDKFGTISVYSKRRGAFSSGDEIVLAALANQGAAALARIRSFAEWKAHGGLMRQIVDEVQSFHADLTETDLCERIAESARKVLGFKMVRVRLLDPETDDLVTVATSGIPEEVAAALKGHRASIKALEPLLAKEFRIERSYLIPHEHEVWAKIPSECFYRPISDNKRKGWSPDDALLTPLMVQPNQMVGLLTVDLPENGMLPSTQVIEAIGIFATAAAWAIERARARKRLIEQQHRTEDFIGSISTELTRCRNVDAVGEVVVQVGAKLLSAEGCSLYLVQGNEIELAHSTFLSATSYIGRRKPINDAPGCGLAAWVAATGETMLFNNGEFESHPAWAGETEHLQYLPSGKCRSLLTVPIKANDDRVIGVLSLENRKRQIGPEGFDRDDIRRLLYLAQQVALALETIGRYQAIEKWERKSLEDDLHELINWYHSGVVLWVDALGKWLENNEIDKIKKHMPELLRHAYTTVDELKTIHTAVTSQYLETVNLRQALLRMTAAWSKRVSHMKPDLPLEVDCPEDIELPAPLRGTFLRIASGAVANAIMHSGAIQDSNVHIRVKVERASNQVILQIYDDGKGRTPLIEGYGIGRMKQLVRQLEKETEFKPKLEIGPSANGGITVTFRAYLREHRDERAHYCSVGR